MPDGPVLIAYDGSELAAHAIAEAGRQLAPGRDAIVLCVWQPVDVGFVPVDAGHLNAQETTQVKHAAEATAERGAELAQAAGFRARPAIEQAAPTWKGICKVAAEQQASLIVLGSHRQNSIVGHLLGSVHRAVDRHTAIPVFVVHEAG